MSNSKLPKSLIVNGHELRIRTNTWDILTILKAFGDPELDDKEKVYVCFVILFKDFDNIPKSEYDEAFKQAVWFLDYGLEPEDGKRPTLVDWEQDENLIYPAINSVAGHEVRNDEYLHWWTFMGYYMEMKDSLFTTILNIRKKKAQHKKLEKWETEFFNNNKKICILAPKLSAEEKAQKEALEKMLGYKR